jgi:Zn-dependent peptidase ImmA (M78 family)
MANPTSIQKGDFLENCIFNFFSDEIATGRFFAKSDCCKVRKKPRYFSRDRDSEIEFDVSIELYLPGALEPSVLVLIECKNYSSPLPVDVAEEFFAKIQQVGAAKSKGIIASNAAFQSGTREFSRAKGIGLLRYFDSSNCKWELKRSPATGGGVDRAGDTSAVLAGLSNMEHRSEIFDFYLQSPYRETNSLWGFFEDLLLDGLFSPTQLGHLLNPQTATRDLAPFLEKDQLEAIASTTIGSVGYTTGRVDLEEICNAENRRNGLTVFLDVQPSLEMVERQVLGRITFRPPCIEVFIQGTPNKGRARFTLAHELAHHLLNHGTYLVQEYCQQSDFSLERSPLIDGANVARMEFQANYLAACLLLPKRHVIEDFRALVASLGLPNRGFGPLFVDNQPCNLQSFEIVLSAIANKYDVSRAAATIRLLSLGLLKDARKSLNSMNAVDIFMRMERADTTDLDNG